MKNKNVVGRVKRVQRVGFPGSLMASAEYGSLGLQRKTCAKLHEELPFDLHCPLWSPRRRTMAPVKRKAVTDERPSKKAKADAPEPASQEKKKTRKSQDGDEKKPALKSILQQEERAFPRGGASVLTPLEHKQIKAQAEQDALFEEEAGKVAAQDDEGELFADAKEASKSKGKKRRQSTEAVKKIVGSGVRIQGLSYKNLVVGSSVLGRITAITSKDVALALPNNLTGYVPITAVSQRLNSRIEKLLAEADQQIDHEDDEDIDLKQLFHVGQWLRSTVISMVTGADAGGKKHIELSLDPVQVNNGITEENFVSNSTIQASIRSVEDHGLVMDLGLPDEAVKGFVSKKELGSAYSLQDLHEGQVLLCLVTGKSSNGRVLKLSADPNRFSVALTGNKVPSISEAPVVDAFQPGTAVDVLVTESGPKGIAGKVMGMLDVTADVVHSGAVKEADMSKKYKIGSKIKARIIFATPQDDGSRRVGISVLAHTLALLPPAEKLPANATNRVKTEAADLSQRLRLSTIVEEATVVQVSPDRGLFLTLPKVGNAEESALAFSHISQVSDSRVDSLSLTSGPYKPESRHRARIISYSPTDNIYYVSLKQSTLDQAFLRIEDLTVGEVVQGAVEKLILGAKGVTGALVKLSDAITGLVPAMHLSDAQLQHPERKFREGFPVKARVLSVDTDKRQVRLTLKKSLVQAEGDAHVWEDYRDLRPGMESKGTIVNLLPKGAAVQFYGQVRAWLPVGEMSENFVQHPEQHFRLGQTVSVRIVSVDAETKEMKVTCKDESAFDAEQQQTWNRVEAGEIIKGSVTAKTAESVEVDLENGLKGVVRVGQLVDGSVPKAEKEFKRIRVGQKLTNIVVLGKLDRSHTLLLSNKPSLVDAASKGNFIASFKDVREGQKVPGFIRNVTPESVYVEFGNGVVGLVPKSLMQPEMRSQPGFGLNKDQSVSVWVTSTDDVRQRFLLSMREPAKTAEPAKRAGPVSSDPDVTNAVDPSIRSMADFTLGKIVKACVSAVKATQINVRLADNIQGRVDVSEAFDSWDEISDKAAPLQKFKPNDLLRVKILGIHDARNHRFLPISHRQGKVPVFELSAKKSRVEAGDESLLGLDTVQPGASHLAFVNNHGDNCVWVNISPNVRGRISLMDLSDDVGQLQNVENRFRIGCALQATIKSVDASTSRLDLTARRNDSAGPLTVRDLMPGMVLPARVTKSSERFIYVQISDSVTGTIPLVELSDNYDQADPTQYQKNDVVRVCILAVDKPNKRVYLSLRPSKVLSSSLPVKDAQITEASQLKPGDIVRGFVKQIADKGVFVALGARVDALVRIADLSDQYVKDWKTILEVDQLVKGRVVSVDAASNQVQLSLKKSHVDSKYTPPLSISDLEPGKVVTGKIRKVEDFGAFIDIDDTQPRLSGLCHRSEVATRRVEDVRKLYSAGDVVKAKVLSVDIAGRKISLGLKATYFDDEDDEAVSEDDDFEMADGGVDIGMDHAADNVFDAEGGVELDDIRSFDSADESDANVMDVEEWTALDSKSGLKTSGFDWTGETLNEDVHGAVSESEAEITSVKKRKHKPEIKQDLTGDLDKYGPRSVSDFERQLLGQPNNSALWIQYMGFQLELSEIQTAREIAQRALRMIHIRETEEKANVWIAWLNLEVEYGDDGRVEDVFKQACQAQDPLEMHEKLASIYINSGRYDKADAIFERIVGNKTFRASPEVWLNYASFLMNTLQAPDRARALLTRALKSVPINEHRQLTAKFASLEFHSPCGDTERGRTIFESIISEWPKWSSGWDMWADLERSQLSQVSSADEKKEAKDRVRALFERVSAQKMKKRRAKFVFKKWLEFEEHEGTERDVERVKALAKEFVERMASGAADEGDE